MFSFLSSATANGCQEVVDVVGFYMDLPEKAVLFSFEKRPNGVYKRLCEQVVHHGSDLAR